MALYTPIWPEIPSQQRADLSPQLRHAFDQKFALILDDPKGYGDYDKGTDQWTAEFRRGPGTFDVLLAVNCGDSSCRPAVSIGQHVHAAIAVGWSVVEVRAERLCRITGLALRRALMRATDLREGGCLRPCRLRADALRLDFGSSSTS